MHSGLEQGGEWC